MVYKTYMTINNLDTTKCYVGMTGKNNPNYKGSGNVICKALTKYGRENFTRVDLGTFNDKDECHFWEGFYVKLYQTHISQSGYNLSYTGGTNFIDGYSHTEETKEKMRKPHKPISEESRKSYRNRIYSTETLIKKSKSMLGKNEGKKRTEEQKSHMRKSHGPMSEEHKQIHRKYKCSEETKQKISKTLKEKSKNK